MGSSWQLQDAKARFSEPLDRAIHDGPQHVTRRGKPTVVVMSSEQYERVVRAASAQAGTLVDLLRECPAPEVLEFAGTFRSPSDVGRSVDLGE